MTEEKYPLTTITIDSEARGEIAGDAIEMYNKLCATGFDPEGLAIEYHPDFQQCLKLAEGKWREARIYIHGKTTCHFKEE